MTEKELRQEISLPAAKQEAGASLLAKHKKKRAHPGMIVPTLCVGMQTSTLRVDF
ncbi:hypothetical protein I5R92_01040 [Pseudomonas carnis]|uniref:hypothetical protein n=1 Tax=Pseudomonas carnis TaxID=2487355 RepID=UPI0018D7FDD6|nr:hypothetical protein [Pseudomonas carnis]MBH3365857.1 hypothetical protein [Pseudomonas carnis]